MNCPICDQEVSRPALETHEDRILKKHYEIYRCPNCEGDFAWPMESTPENWYAQAYPIRLLTATTKSDWRYEIFFTRHPRGPGRFLDIGTGSGALVGAAQARGYEAVGVDYDSRTILWGAKQGIRNLIAQPLKDYLQAQPNATYDWIALCEVLEHVESPSWLLGEIRRLLKPGGGVAIWVPNRGRPLPFAREEHDYPPHHLTRWLSSTLRRGLEHQGLQVDFVADRYIPPSYLSHLIFDHFFQRLLRLLRGMTSDKLSSAIPKSISESPSAIQSRRLKRQRWVNAARSAFIYATFPPAWAVLTFYTRRHIHRGYLLYAEARRPLI